MDRTAEIKSLVDEFTGHLDMAGDLSEVIEKSLEKLGEKLPAERVAKILSTAGGWLKVALSPISKAYKSSTDRWFDSRVAFIKKEAGIEKISEAAALRLIEIKSLQMEKLAKSVGEGAKSNDSKSK